MKSRKFLWLSLAALFGLAAVVLLTNRKSVTLIYAGHTYPVTTFAGTVSGVLDQAGLPVHAEDEIQPLPDQRVRDGATITVRPARPVVLRVDGKELHRHSAASALAQLLAQANIQLGPHDALYLNGAPIDPSASLDPQLPAAIEIKRAATLTIDQPEGTLSLQTTAQNVAEALWQAGVLISAADRLLPADLTAPLAATTIEIQPARTIHLLFKDQLLAGNTTAETVGAALAEAGYPLQGLDYSVPASVSPLPSNGRIRVVRVEEAVTLEVQPLAFDSELQPDASLALDEQKILQPGAYGLTARRVRSRLEDGVEVSRITEDEYIAQEPQPRILGYGTKIVPSTISTPSGTFQYWRALSMYAVSYNPTSAGGNITASGLPLQKGLVAVDPNIIPLGTRLYVPGYGEALAADTGGGVRGRMIDLGYSDHDYVPWHEWLTVYFLWPPPENIVWYIP